MSATEPARVGPGFEQFFIELAARLAEPGAVPPVVAAELNRKYGVEMIEDRS